MKLIYLNKLLILFLLVYSGSILGQTNMITGKVLDTKGEPIIGAAIQVKGTSVGTITDLDGNFAISASQGILKISFVGMKSQEISIAGKKVINVTLEDEAIAINDVVVIGYSSVKKKELTGAVAQVKATDISRINTSDLGNALQGMVSGVSVVSESGAPGASSNILIRGVTSVNGQNTPLYVVDGIPQEGDPKLSPNEIETIDILKDAASCAIYGTRGAAGVILVTTKQGSAGNLKVSLDASYGIQQIISKNYLMNSVEQTYFDLISRRNTGRAADDEAILDLFQNKAYFQNNTDLFDLTFVDNASVQNYNVNLSGGSKELTFNLTSGYYNKEGVLINSNFERFNTRANFSYNKNKWHLGGSIGVSNENTQFSPWGMINQSIRYTPKQPTLNLDPSQAITVSDGDAKNTIGWVLQQYQIENNQYMRNSFSNFNLAYDIAKGLTISSRLGLSSSSGYTKEFRPYQELIDKNTGLPFSSPESSYLKMRSLNNNSFTWDATIQYKKSIAKNNFTGLFGASTERYAYVGFGAQEQGVSDNQIKSFYSTTINPTILPEFNYVNTLMGFIGRLQYDWNQRYLFNISLRRDGSSKFAKENRWGWFPSFSAAWNLSDEPFFEKAKELVNNLKIRASYGTTGNQSFGSYTYATNITTGNGLDYVFGVGANDAKIGATQVVFANTAVKWETSKQYNFGTDISLLDNKITFAAEYYRTAKDNMLFPIELPGSSGGTTNYNSSRVTLNVGNMINEGIELSSEYRSVIGDLNYSIKGTFSTNQNVITFIPGRTDGSIMFTGDDGLIPEAKATSQVTVLTVGHEAGAFYLYTTNGIANTHKKLADYQQLVPTAKMGDLIYLDNNHDGQISAADRVYSGSGMPKYEIGFNFNLAYKGFDLNLNLYSALGHKIMNGSKAVAFYYGRHRDLVGSWTEVNQDSPIPAYRGEGHANYLAYTDLWLEDGSYLRLKQASIGYSLPKSLLNKIKIKQLRVYLSTQNPFTLTKYSGYDPEIGGNISSRGLDKGNYPNSALYTVGMNFNF